jgi:flavorubredoxin
MVKKNQKPTPEYDSQRETRVLLEEIRSEVKVVAEQHGDIMKKLGNTIRSLREWNSALITWK